MTAPTKRILSLGAGVQSSALLILAARGDLPRLDAAIFSDTAGSQRPFTSTLTASNARWPSLLASLSTGLAPAISGMMPWILPTVLPRCRFSSRTVMAGMV